MILPPRGLVCEPGPAFESLIWRSAPSETEKEKHLLMMVRNRRNRFLAYGWLDLVRSIDISCVAARAYCFGIIEFDASLPQSWTVVCFFGFCPCWDVEPEMYEGMWICSPMAKPVCSQLTTWGSAALAVRWLGNQCRLVAVLTKGGDLCPLDKGILARNL